MKLLMLIAATLWVCATPSTTFAWDPQYEKDALRRGLAQYTSCNAACASGLASTIIDKSIEEATDLVGTLSGVSSEEGKKITYLLFYQLIRRSIERGDALVSSHGACSNQCDALNSDIVALGRRGALGPLLRNGKVDASIFDYPGVIEILIRYIKPIDPDDLPWPFHNEDWLKKVSQTG